MLEGGEVLTGRKQLMGEFGIVFQNEPVDISEVYSKQENHFFIGDRVEEFDPASGSGKICWIKQRVSYHHITLRPGRFVPLREPATDV